MVPKINAIVIFEDGNHSVVSNIDALDAIKASNILVNTEGVFIEPSQLQYTNGAAIHEKKYAGYTAYTSTLNVDFLVEAVKNLHKRSIIASEKAINTLGKIDTKKVSTLPEDIYDFYEGNILEATKAYRILHGLSLKESVSDIKKAVKLKGYKLHDDIVFSSEDRDVNIGELVSINRNKKTCRIRFNSEYFTINFKNIYLKSV